MCSVAESRKTQVLSGNTQRSWLMFVTCNRLLSYRNVEHIFSEFMRDCVSTGLQKVHVCFKYDLKNRSIQTLPRGTRTKQRALQCEICLDYSYLGCFLLSQCMRLILRKEKSVHSGWDPQGGFTSMSTTNGSGPGVTGAATRQVNEGEMMWTSVSNFHTLRATGNSIRQPETLLPLESCQLRLVHLHAPLHLFAEEKGNGDFQRNSARNWEKATKQPKGITQEGSGSYRKNDETKQSTNQMLNHFSHDKDFQRCCKLINS